MTGTDADLQAIVDGASASPRPAMVRIETDLIVSVCRELLERRRSRDTAPIPLVTLDEPIVRHEDHLEACDWIDAVNEVAGDASVEIPPAPIDALVDFIREGGELGESPSLALLDQVVGANRRIAALEGLLAGERAGREAEKARADELECRIANALL